MRFSRATRHTLPFADGRMVEIYATDDGATWSMVITTPEGQSCVVASGEAWAERVQSELGQAV